MNGSEMINEILKDVKAGNQTLVEVSKKLLGDKEAIIFAVEHRQVQPELPKLAEKMESPMRSHCFHDADGFALYLTKYKTDDTVVMVDVQEQIVCAILNEKAANGFEIVKLSPILYPLFTPWQVLLDHCEMEPQPLKKFVEFLSEHRRAIVEPERKGIIMALSQVKVSRNITLHKGVAGNQRINGIICEMDIAGQKQNQEVQIPETIKIETPLYLSKPAVQFEIDISIDADDQNVYVKCSSADLMQRKLDAFEVIVQKVKSIPGVVVCMGRPNHEDWDRIDGE